MKHTALPWHVAANATMRDKKGDYIFEDRPEAEIAENKAYAELACNNFEEMAKVLKGLMVAYGATDGRNGNSGECWDNARAILQRIESK